MNMPLSLRSETITDKSGVILQHIGKEKADDRSPLIAINGLGSGIEPWGDFLNRLDRYVIAIDVRRAIGKCALPNPLLIGVLPPHLSDYSAVLRRTLHDHDIIEPGKPADILGFSWGAHLAARATIDYPQDFRKLVVAAGTPGVQMVMPSLAVMNALSNPDRKSAVDKSFIRKVYGGELGRHPEMAETLGIKRDIDPVLYAQQLGAVMMSFMDPHDFYRMRLPMSAQMAMNPHETLVMAGTDDPITPYQNALLLNDIMPKSRLSTMHNDGHYFLLTNPKHSADMVGAFLDRANG